MDGVLGFDCPRCSRAVSESFYGPCARCRDELRQSESGARRDVKAEAYSPKMNVTPNSVALKDD